MTPRKSKKGDVAAPPKLGKTPRGALDISDEPDPLDDEPQPEKKKPAPKRQVAGTLSGYYIGIQSGTSMDGADVALVAISGDTDDPNIELLESGVFSYPQSLKEKLFALRGAFGSAEAKEQGPSWPRRLMALDLALGSFFGQSIVRFLSRLRIDRRLVRAVGSHGQTVFHDPPRFTLQIGSPEFIARLLNIPVIAEFRKGDLAVGGQGAPLVPMLDYYLLRHPKESRLLINIGGICNLTYLPANCRKSNVIGFDAGPGNCLIDRYMREILIHPLGYDPEGAIAARGRVDQGLLYKLATHPYLEMLPPKSADLPTFEILFKRAVHRQIKKGLSHEDVLATLTALTVVGINLGWVLMNSPPIDRVFVTGGGANNRTMIRRIENLFESLLRRSSPVSITLPIKMDPKAKEAVLFALLAHHHLHGIPGNLPQVTGAKKAVVLGTRFDP